MQGRNEYSDPTLLNEACWIDLGHDHAPINCRINEIYDHWAYIECPASSQVPDYFFLFLTVDGRVARKCRMISRSNSKLVLKFLDKPVLSKT
jgi:hypothetical protein